VYEIVVIGLAERTLRAGLDDLIVECRACGDNDTLTVVVRDRSALVAAIGRLHDLGAIVDEVRRLR
jgi:hypothetical protein